MYKIELLSFGVDNFYPDETDIFNKINYLERPEVKIEFKVGDIRINISGLYFNIGLGKWTTNKAIYIYDGIIQKGVLNKQFNDKHYYTLLRSWMSKEQPFAQLLVDDMMENKTIRVLVNHLYSTFQKTKSHIEGRVYE